MSEAQHRIANAPITLIKKGTSLQGHFHIGLYWMFSSGYHFSVKILQHWVKNLQKNPEPGRGGGGGGGGELDTSFITIFSSFGRI